MSSAQDQCQMIFTGKKSEKKLKKKKENVYLGFHATAYIQNRTYNNHNQSDPQTEQKTIRNGA